MSPGHRSSLAKRTPLEWAVRCGLAIVAASVGFVSIQQTLAYTLSRSATATAYRLSPGDGRIAGLLAAQLLVVEKPQAAERARARRLARKALMDEPMSVPAVTALAIANQLSGDTTQARRLFLHSDALSRRDLITRLWLVEDAVGREDIPGALRHYDIALRTSRNASDILFPVMAQAIADPVVAKEVTKTLAAGPPWRDAFTGFIPSSGISPRIAGAFFQRAVAQGVPVQPLALASVVSALITSGRVEQGWRLYASVRKGTARDRSRDPQFTAQPSVPMVFDWAPISNDLGVSASFQRADQRGVFDFAVPSTLGGIVLQQGQYLPPGNYRLDGVSHGIEQGQGARPFWQLVCSDGREVGRVEVTNSSADGGRFSGVFNVGPNCAFQTLRFVIRPSPDIEGVAGQISHIQLERSK